MRRSDVFRGSVLAAGVFACIASMSGLASAASVSDAYLLSNWTITPTAPNANPMMPPFELSSTQGLKLSLNSSGVATGFTALSGSVLFPTLDIDFPLTHVSHSSIDSGEGSITSAYVNSEIAKWDDGIFVQEGPTDAPLNIDFGNDGWVILTWTGALTHLVIAEDAGLDPFKLYYDSDGFGTGVSSMLLFNGFDDDTRDDILDRPEFDSVDDQDIDQAYVFLFDIPLEGGFLKIKETKNFNKDHSTKLEVDFVGGAVVPPPDLPSDPVIPLPAGVWAGMVGFGMLTARRRMKKTPKQS